MKENSLYICNWCNQTARVIWVHGHYQCSVCGINVDECCRGEMESESIIEIEIKEVKDSESKDD